MFWRWSGAVLCPACWCGHRPLALMVSADKVPFCFAGCDALDIRRVVLIPGLTGSPSHRIVLATSGSAVVRLILRLRLREHWHAIKPPRTMIAQITRAALLASATVTRRAGLRDSRAASQDRRPRACTSRAGPARSCRRREAGADICRPSSRCVPAVPCRRSRCCNGVRPSQAANCRPERNWVGSVTEAANAVAQTVPTPGIVASRRATSFERCQASSSRSILAQASLGIEHLLGQTGDHLCREMRDVVRVTGDCAGTKASACAMPCGSRCRTPPAGCGSC